MCRPKRNLILYCADDEKMSLFRFVLANQTSPYSALLYQIHSVTSYTEAMEAALRVNTKVATLIVALKTRNDDDSELICNLDRQVKGSTSFLIMGFPTTHSLDGRFRYIPHGTNMDTILETLRTIAQRKRGPSKAACNPCIESISSSEQIRA